MEKRIEESEATTRTPINIVYKLMVYKLIYERRDHKLMIYR